MNEESVRLIMRALFRGKPEEMDRDTREHIVKALDTFVERCPVPVEVWRFPNG